MSTVRKVAIEAVKDHPSTAFMTSHEYESLADVVLTAVGPLLHAEGLREGADFLSQIGTPITGQRSEHERGVMYASERLRSMATIEPGEKAAPGTTGTTTSPHAVIITALMQLGYDEASARQLFAAATGQSTEPVFYRASRHSITLGHYVSRDAAHECCETLIRRDIGDDVFLSWVPSHNGNDAPEELCTTKDAECTGYHVTPVEVIS